MIRVNVHLSRRPPTIGDRSQPGLLQSLALLRPETKQINAIIRIIKTKISFPDRRDQQEVCQRTQGVRGRLPKGRNKLSSQMK